MITSDAATRAADRLGATSFAKFSLLNRVDQLATLAHWADEAHIKLTSNCAAERASGSAITFRLSLWARSAGFAA